MKNIKNFLVIVLAMVIAVQYTNAQDYKHPYNVKENGEVVNDKGVKLGWIEKDGTIKNAKGEAVGKKEKNQLNDKVGKKMGAVSEDGTLTGKDGKVLFKISTADENGICKILDAKGKEVGTVHQNYKQQGACAIHCLGKK